MDKMYLQALLKRFFYFVLFYHDLPQFLLNTQTQVLLERVQNDSYGSVF
nr:MAG TPA: hypothetical protein [Caudoviricetes sp.]